MLNFLIIFLLGVVSVVAFIGWSRDTTSTERDTTNAPAEVTDESSGQTQTDSLPRIPLFSGEVIEVYAGISVPKQSTTLDVSKRGLTGSLKAEVRHLSELTTLDVSNNSFTGLPAEVGQLSKLRTLNLSNNEFTGLPHELSNLKNLELLDLRGNDISPFDLDIIRRGLPPTVKILQ